MKVFLFICIFAITIACLHGAVSISSGNHDPDHPEGCFTEEAGHMKSGEMKTVPGCARVECLGGGTIQIATCGISEVHTPKGRMKCFPSEKNTSHYPECCKPESDLSNCKYIN